MVGAAAINQENILGAASSLFMRNKEIWRNSKAEMAMCISIACTCTVYIENFKLSLNW